jgi:hypothetical protein
MDLNGLIAIVVRFLHIGSAAGLVGGVLYARLAATPVLNNLPVAERAAAAEGAQSRFKGVLFTLLLLVVLSGVYNGFGPNAPHHGHQWQMWFGIKMLGVLHFLATAILWATTPYGDVAIDGKGKRRLAGLVISGFAIVLLGSILRYLTANGL